MNLEPSVQHLSPVLPQRRVTFVAVLQTPLLATLTVHTRTALDPKIPQFKAAPASLTTMATINQDPTARQGPTATARTAAPHLICP
jgi:hypothetical protein